MEDEQIFTIGNTDVKVLKRSIQVRAKSGTASIKPDASSYFTTTSTSWVDVTGLYKDPEFEIGKKLALDYPCFNIDEEKYYSISKSFFGIGVSHADLFTTVAKFDNFVDSYLQTIVRLMRLFREGNVCMPLRYY
ncbi:MAG: hypothetical protein IH795_05445, partial [Bacteroidetes bacterium]|nr:hypothetical protein [Bacteroidota bacterium]